MISGSAVCSSFKQELFQAVHNFNGHQFRLALYTAAATLNAETTLYAPDFEVVGVGYDAGGKLLANVQVLLHPGARAAYVTFDDPIWGNSVIVARAGLIYNATAGNRAVAVFDFGADRTSNHGPFRVMLPPVGPATALIRIR